MRIASFNVENLFEWVVALNQGRWTSEPGENPSRWAAGRLAQQHVAKGNGASISQRRFFIGFRDLYSSIYAADQRRRENPRFRIR